VASQVSAVINFPVRDTSAPSGVGATLASSATATGGATVEAANTFQAATGSAQPVQMLTIQNLGNGRVFVHPLFVTVEQAGDDWCAVSADLALVGRGESDLEALDDLRAGISELLDSLSEMRNDLGPLMRDQLAFLERLTGAR